MLPENGTRQGTRCWGSTHKVQHVIERNFKKIKKKEKKKTERGNCYISNTRKFPRVEVPESLDWKIPLSTSGNWVYQG